MPLKKGFTLIELLIAISILGILVSIIAYSVTGQQRKARDAQRKSDFQQLKRAMESAKNDCHATSYYPVVFASSTTTQFNDTADHLKTGLNLLTKSVRDPKNDTTYFYTLNTPDTLTQNVCPDSSGSKTIEGSRYFVARVKLEISNDPDAEKSRQSCTDSISQVTWATLPSANDGYFYSCPD